MTFTEAEQFLYSLSNLPRKEYMTGPRDCDEYLLRLQFFLDILENPEKNIPHYIHITGTSGKGSTVNYLHSILACAGKKVASTTSPHPTTITERWKVGNTFMTKKEFIDIIEKLKPKLDEYIRTSPYDILSYFDMTTAIALYYFAKKKVDWAILEVGCGGTYDATNVIPYKDVAVITNIGLDHTTLLGNTKTEIAKRKAGIITDKTNVFSAETSPQIVSIIKKSAEKKHSSFTLASKKDLTNISIDLRGTTFTFQKKQYHTTAIGKHQATNAALAICIARSLDIKKDSIKKGIAKANQPLRMDVISQKPLIIIDGAHNPDKIKTTVTGVTQAFRLDHKNDTHLIVGFSGNKDLKKMIKQLVELKPVSVACTRNTINHFRKVASPSELAPLWKKEKTNARLEQFLDPADALACTLKIAKKNDLILVTGSLFLASEIKGLL
jgi:dihydrofolate synthase / folylpolyglutamate synthase